MRFPKELTEEELVLKEKYELIRKKKQAVVEQEEAEKKKDQPPKKISSKRHATDAKEHAKRLVLDGKIKIAVPSNPQEEKKNFKRPNVEKKASLTTSITGSSKDGGETGRLGSIIPKNTVGDGSPAAATVTSATRQRSPVRFDYGSIGSFTIPPLDASSTNVPKRGPSIYVSTQGHVLSEETLRTIFGRFGRIVRVRLSNPGVAFVTFATTESAEHAISEMHQTIQNGVEYELEFAWRQPQPFMRYSHDSHYDAPYTTARASMSTPNQPATGSKSWDYKRKQVVYDDDEI
ncbi:Negative elongation factor E [Orchesella cincta]|uniref:Negative elongation factor E n=1 Tax=Orchesella cincta TaxID=48709 RepID=A0A1D2MAI8_ORCCI|nr:Negative elongation factor E [Orchesella cincta]